VPAPALQDACPLPATTSPSARCRCHGLPRIPACLAPAPYSAASFLSPSGRGRGTLNMPALLASTTAVAFWQHSLCKLTPVARLLAWPLCWVPARFMPALSHANAWHLMLSPLPRCCTFCRQHRYTNASLAGAVRALSNYHARCRCANFAAALRRDAYASRHTVTARNATLRFMRADRYARDAHRLWNRATAFFCAQHTPAALRFPLHIFRPAATYYAAGIAHRFYHAALAPYKPVILLWLFVAALHDNNVGEHFAPLYLWAFTRCMPLPAFLPHHTNAVVVWHGAIMRLGYRPV